MKKRGVLSYLEPLEQRTRGAAVLDALADMVERAGLEIGDRLPPEVSLAEQLGVGRSTIREALNRWEGLGMIRRRRGDGTYLSARVQTMKGPVPTMIRLEGEALLRLIEVRRALECAVVQRAAQNATARQKAEIRRLCDQLIADVDAGLPWRRADAAFHSAIYEASGNPMFGRFCKIWIRRLNGRKSRPLVVTRSGCCLFRYTAVWPKPSRLATRTRRFWPSPIFSIRYRPRFSRSSPKACANPPARQPARNGRADGCGGPPARQWRCPDGNRQHPAEGFGGKGCVTVQTGSAALAAGGSPPRTPVGYFCQDERQF